MAFTEKPKWVTMDEANDATGYHTYMKTGAETWVFAVENVFYVILLLIFIPFALFAFTRLEHEYESEEWKKFIALVFVLCIPMAFLMMLYSFRIIQDTDQTKPEAWAVNIFKSCNVTVETTHGLNFVLYVVAVTGVVTVVEYGLLAVVLCVDACVWCGLLVPLAEMNPAELPRSGSGSSSNNTNSSLPQPLPVLYPSETQSLLGDSGGDKSGSDSRGRTKQESTRYYQTAEEYLETGGDDDDSGDALPLTPATAVPVITQVPVATGDRG